jgi:hypothetical protein
MFKPLHTTSYAHPSHKGLVRSIAGLHFAVGWFEFSVFVGLNFADLLAALHLPAPVDPDSI